MRSYTHIAFSTLMYVGVATLLEHKVSPQEIALASLGALLPDIDTTKSFLGRLLYPLSRYLEEKLGHRGATHSLLASALPFLALFPLSFWHAFALWIGYVGHLIADMMTVSGVPLFYPYMAVCVIPGNDDLRIRTGSAAEHVLLAVIISLLHPLKTLNSVGLEKALHRALGTVSGAVVDYVKLAPSKRVYASIEGVFSFSQVDASGRYEVVARLDENTLLVQDEEGNLYSVGKKQENEIYPRRVVIEEGEAVTWNSTVLNLTGMTPEQLSKIPGRMTGSGLLLDPSGVHDPIVFYPSIQGAERNVKIVWAKGEDFLILGRNVFVSGRVVVRYTGRFPEVRKYSGVRVYEYSDGRVVVAEGEKVRKGQVLVSLEAERRALREKIEELKKGLKEPSASLSTIPSDLMRRRYSAQKKEREKITRRIEELMNKLLKLVDVVAESDGIVYRIDEDRIIVLEVEGWESFSDGSSRGE